MDDRTVKTKGGTVIKAMNKRQVDDHDRGSGGGRSQGGRVSRMPPNYLPSPATIEAAKARFRESKLEQMVGCGSDVPRSGDFAADAQAFADVERILAEGTEATAEDQAFVRVVEVPTFCQERISLETTDDQLIAIADAALRKGSVWNKSGFTPERSQLIEAMKGFRRTLEISTSFRRLFRKASGGRELRHIRRAVIY
ncbi:MAG TPA: hypothetical protein DCQ98_20375 [Planctomycetaceae bacterium]|nr:hypothetical protein [Planctomycetaceae bacterium]